MVVPAAQQRQHRGLLPGRPFLSTTDALCAKEVEQKATVFSVKRFAMVCCL